MKKLLLGLAFIATGISFAAAEEDTQLSPKVFETDELGDVNGVSDNGRFVAISFLDNEEAILWDRNNPNVFEYLPIPYGDFDLPSAQRVTGIEVYDVSDDGITVGCLVYADSHSEPAYYKNGEWYTLPLPANVQNTNIATLVTPDAKSIVGYCNHRPAGLDFGQYFPVQWNLNDNGEYDVVSYGNVKLPEHQGFIPMCLSPDGKIIGGTVYAGMSSQLPALFVNGQLKMFYDITYRNVPHTYKGTYYCGRDENGNQIWTDDPDDPRILYFKEELIDGYNDGSNALTGFFDFCDGDGNFYGRRSIIRDLSEDGNSARITEPAAIYNINADQWTDNLRYAMFTCGLGQDLIFDNNSNVIVDGVKYNIEDYYDFTSRYESVGINKISLNGNTLGGVSRELVEAIGDYVYYPYIIIPNYDPSGVNTVYGGTEKPFVLLSKGKIEVRNIPSANLYNLDGHIIGAGSEFSVEPGIYLVKADRFSAKVVVK